MSVDTEGMAQALYGRPSSALVLNICPLPGHMPPVTNPCQGRRKQQLLSGRGGRARGQMSASVRLSVTSTAAAAAAVKSERVCRSGHWPAIRCTQSPPVALMPSDSSEQRQRASCEPLSAVAEREDIILGTQHRVPILQLAAMAAPTATTAADRYSTSYVVDIYLDRADLDRPLRS